MRKNGVHMVAEYPVPIEHIYAQIVNADKSQCLISVVSVPSGYPVYSDMEAEALKHLWDLEIGSQIPSESPHEVFKKQFKNKTFSQLSVKEKDDILEQLAQRAGIIT